LKDTPSSAVAAKETSPKAIETYYAGCHFRSRIEARWAVFFDAVGIPWEYELEGFELPSGLYLPDFWLPTIGRHGTWFEVKGPPQQWNNHAFQLLHELCDDSDVQWALVYGPIPYETDPTGNDEAQTADRREITVNGDSPYNFCGCPWCGKVGLEFDARGARVCGWEAHFDDYDEALAVVKKAGHWRADDKCYTGDDYRILAGYRAARAARFEHGECGG
jgi:hypothetical protein